MPKAKLQGGYYCDITKDKVEPIAPSLVGSGAAEISFKRSDGGTYDDKCALVKIPSLPLMNITADGMDKVNKDLPVMALRSSDTYFPRDQIAIEMSVSYFSIKNRQINRGLHTRFRDSIYLSKSSV